MQHNITRRQARAAERATRAQRFAVALSTAIIFLAPVVAHLAR